MGPRSHFTHPSALLKREEKANPNKTTESWESFSLLCAGHGDNHWHYHHHLCTLGWVCGEAGNTPSAVSAGSESHFLLKTTGMALKKPNKLVVIPPFNRYVTPPTPRLAPDLLSYQLQQTCDLPSVTPWKSWYQLSLILRPEFLWAVNNIFLFITLDHKSYSCPSLYEALSHSHQHQCSLWSTCLKQFAQSSGFAIKNLHGICSELRIFMRTIKSLLLPFMAKIKRNLRRQTGLFWPLLIPNLCKPSSICCWWGWLRPQ